VSQTGYCDWYMRTSLRSASGSRNDGLLWARSLVERGVIKVAHLQVTVIQLYRPPNDTGHNEVDLYSSHISSPSTISKCRRQHHLRPINRPTSRRSGILQRHSLRTATRWKFALATARRVCLIGCPECDFLESIVHSTVSLERTRH